MEFNFVLLSITLTFLFIINRTFFNRSRIKNHPPGPIGLPVLGNLHQLGPRPHESLSNLSKIYGHLMSLRLGSITVVIASSPSTAQEILHKNDQTFANRPIPDSVAAQPHVEGTLAWVPGNHRWRNRRRICSTQMFTDQKLDSLQHFRHSKVHQLIQHIKKHSLAGTPVDIGALAFASTLNLISNTIFSIDLVDPNFETAGEFKDLVWRIMEDAGKPNISDYFPVLKRFDLQGVRRHVQVSYFRLHEIFDEIIEKRLKSRELSDERNGDFLDILLDQMKEGGSGFSIETIKPLILDLFIAGSDTSGLTTEWAMAELLHKPETLKKARKEVLEVIGANREVKESDINRLPYIQAIVKETLRLHPPVPLLLPYVAGNNVEIGGHTIKKGNQVMINAWCIGRNPQYWDDPMSFLPERFMGSKIDYKGRDFEYLPFGAGRRICPGLPLANRMVNLMLAAIIHSYDWKLPEGVTPKNLDMTEQYGITLKKAVPVCAIPIIDQN
ncbi:Cytochrome P450 family protein [Quillaja saponaria]|uniref:Cytochrome P450 family protein n=1 Tax=Quillaja saponaria TaxID=32244 RepID=A0AAD7PZQ8_QUISA|nr:Cytochrome P450 family protein [Quillaja saponaria]